MTEVDPLAYLWSIINSATDCSRHTLRDRDSACGTKLQGNAGILNSTSLQVVVVPTLTTVGMEDFLTIKLVKEFLKSVHMSKLLINIKWHTFLRHSACTMLQFGAIAYLLLSFSTL